MTDSGRTPGKRGRWRWRRTRGALLATFLVLAVPIAVYGFNSVGTTWSSVYPTSQSRNNAGCQLCHQDAGGGDPFNAYGWAIRGAGTSAAQIQSIEGANSDGDPGGASNLAEINANSQPGWTVGNNNTIFFIDGSTQTNQPPPAGIGLLDPAASASPSPSPAVSPSPSPAVSPSPSPAVSPSPSPAVSPSPSPAVSPSPSAAPSVSPTPTPSPGPAEPFIDTSADTVVAGQNLGVFGQGYMGGTDVQIWLESTHVLLKTVAAAADGTFSTTVLIPVGTAAGAYSIVSMGLGADDASLTLTAAITVTAPTPPPTSTVDSSESPGTPPIAAMLALLLAIAGAALTSAMYVRSGQRR